MTSRQEIIDMANIIKVFDGENIVECLHQCFVKDYVPLSTSVTRVLLEEGLVPSDKTYATRSISIGGIHREATLDELKHIQDFYVKGGRIFNVCLHKDRCGTYDNLVGPVNFITVPMTDEEKRISHIDDIFNDLSRYVPQKDYDSFRKDIEKYFL